MGRVLEQGDLARVAAGGRSVWEIAAHYTEAFMDDLERLRVRPATVWAKATDHVEEMIEFAGVVEEKGYAYEIEAGLFFDTSKVPDYGTLALLDLEGLREGARVAPIQTLERTAEATPPAKRGQGAIVGNAEESRLGVLDSR